MSSPGVLKCITCRAVSGDPGQQNWFRVTKDQWKKAINYKECWSTPVKFQVIAKSKRLLYLQLVKLEYCSDLALMSGGNSSEGQSSKIWSFIWTFSQLFKLPGARYLMGTPFLWDFVVISIKGCEEGGKYFNRLTEGNPVLLITAGNLAIHKNLGDENQLCKQGGNHAPLAVLVAGHFLSLSLSPAIWIHSLNLSYCAPSLPDFLLYLTICFCQSWLTFCLYLIIPLAWFCFEYPVCHRW